MRKKWICKKYLIFFMTFVLFFSLAGPAWVSSAPASAEIDMEVKGGYEDAARLGYFVPFSISMVNRGEEITGEVQVIVNTNPETRAAYAMPITLPKGSNKAVAINVPVNTANRKIEVRIVKDGKTLKSVEFEFKKLIPPENPVIGILSDDSNGFRELNGMKISENTTSPMAIDMQRKMAVAIAAGERMAVLPDRPVELIQLNKDSLPDDVKALNGFDFLVLSNYDTSTLSDKQKEAIDAWVAGGKTLFIGTGPNWKKTYAGLPDNLKPFNIDGTKNIPAPKSIGTFTEKNLSGSSMNIATGNTGNGKVIISEGMSPLAVLHKKGEGSITTLAFDPSLSPIAGWEGTQILWKNLIAEIGKQTDKSAAAQVATMYPGRSYVMNFEYLTQNVPEDQTPPFVMLLVVLSIYIVLAGPVIYLILKKKDKRDFNWVAIPLIAVIFMGTIYVLGFKTRYTTAVLNSISAINLRPENNSADVSTSMGVFNNSRGDMKIEYDKAINLSLNTQNYYYDSGMYYQPPQNQNSKILSKTLFSDPPVYELYDVRMWEPRTVMAGKTMPLSGGMIHSVSISEGIFKAVVKNTMELSLKEAFIAVGNHLIEIGDMALGEERKVEASLGMTATSLKLDAFLDGRYGQPNPQPGKKLPADWSEKNKRRNMIQTTFMSSYWNQITGQPKIFFGAFNYEDMGYDLTVNGKDPKRYSTNIIYSVMNMNFESGRKVTIPTGIIRSSMEPDSAKIAFIDGDLASGGLRINNNGDIDFKFTLPDNITPEQFRLSWSLIVPSYIKYQQIPAGVQQPPMAKNEYKFYIYNNNTSHWEEIDKEFAVDKNPAAYITQEKEIKVRTSAVVDRNGRQDELLGMPELEISGVVK